MGVRDKRENRKRPEEPTRLGENRSLGSVPVDLSISHLESIAEDDIHEFLPEFISRDAIG